VEFDLPPRLRAAEDVGPYGARRIQTEIYSRDIPDKPQFSRGFR